MEVEREWRARLSAQPLGIRERAWKNQSIEIAGLANLTIASRRRRWSSSPTVAKILIISMEPMLSWVKNKHGKSAEPDS